MLDAIEANDLIHNDSIYEDFYINLNKKIFSVQTLMAGIISNGKFPMYSKVKPFLSFSDLNLYGFLIG
jgi:hypothetical protein